MRKCSKHVKTSKEHSVYFRLYTKAQLRVYEGASKRKIANGIQALDGRLEQVKSRNVKIFPSKKLHLHPNAPLALLRNFNCEANSSKLCNNDGYPSLGAGALGGNPPLGGKGFWKGGKGFWKGGKGFWNGGKGFWKGGLLPDGKGCGKEG